MKIIIADDHEFFRRSVVEYLTNVFPSTNKKKKTGQSNTLLDIKEAANGDEVLTLDNSFKPDIIILDLEMPKMSGIDTITFLKKRKSNARILIVSMYRHPALLQETLNLDVQGYLVKGENEQDIKTAILTLYEGGRFFAPSVLAYLQSEVIKSSDKTKLLRLTDRELMVLQFIAQEKSNREIGALIGVSDRVIKKYCGSLLEKCEVKDIAALVRFTMNYRYFQTSNNEF
uniref:Response regulator transcription factor n=1 Tax=Roseihalotalea indica TaxID=2867963 RepID=A0AA49GH14_9BACT|nr:response regulator transcription factor [Tunicatimonas sp. TK19036]